MVPATDVIRCFRHHVLHTAVTYGVWLCIDIRSHDSKCRLMWKMPLSSHNGAIVFDCANVWTTVSKQVEPVIMFEGFRPGLPENTLFDAGHLQVMNQSSAEKLSHPFEKSTLFTVHLQYSASIEFGASNILAHLDQICKARWSRQTKTK